MAQLALAQSQGIEYVVNKQDDPLVKCRWHFRLPSGCRRKAGRRLPKPTSKSPRTI